MPSSSSQRADIQALRAVAVMLVVLYHLWPGAMHGGYVGVDVFFVISGFLITSHLLREADRSSTVRLGQFWARRAYRLLPASLLVIAVTTIAVIVFVPSNHHIAEFHSALGSTFYVQNWVLAQAATDYSESAGAPSAFQHFWSLSVEEQYYIVLPLLLVATTALTRERWRRAFLGVVAVIVLLSLAWSIHLTAANPAAAYFVTTTRAWEFGAGALLGFAPAAWFDRVPVVTSWLGMGAITVAALTFTSATPFPGSAALLPVLGTVLVIATLRHDRIFSTVAELRPVQFIGDASYSIYLWHWPLVALAPWILDRVPSLADRVVILVASILIGYLSLRWVETPWRAQPRQVLKWRDSSAKVVAATMSFALLSAVVLLGTLQLGQAQARELEKELRADPQCFGANALFNNCRTPDGVVPALSLLDQEDAKIGNQACWSKPLRTELNICRFGPKRGAKLKVAVTGDSHMAALLPVYQHLATKYRWRVEVMGHAACFPLDVPLAQPRPNASTCQKWGAKAQRHIEQGRYDLVIVTHSDHIRASGPDAQTKFRRTVAGLRKSWTGFTASGAKVIALQDVPFFGDSTFRCSETDDLQQLLGCGIAKKKAYPAIDTQTAAANHVRGSYVVRTSDFMCRADVCPMVAGGVRMYFNRIHVTRTYADSMADRLGQRIAARYRVMSR